MSWSAFLRYSVLLVLEDKFGEDRQLLTDIKELSESLKDLIYPGWTSQPTAQKEVEKTIRLFMRRYIKRYNQTLDDINILYDKIIDRVKAYAKEN